jgi:hypothetical protein
MVAALKESLTVGQVPEAVGRNRFIAPLDEAKSTGASGQADGTTKRLRHTRFCIAQPVSRR